jgi:excisionase family DNA binding protein
MSGLLSTLSKIAKQKSELLKQEAQLWEELTNSLQEFELYKNNTLPPEQRIQAEKPLLIRDGLLSTKEAAKYIGISEKTLPVWRVRGEGPEYVKIGRLVRYEKKALDRYIGDRRHNSD